MMTAQIHSEAVQAARKAVSGYIEKYGEGPFNCGFAWVSSYEKGNTVLGKSLKQFGFEKSYSGGYQLWDPANSFTQDMSAKYEGARAYVDTVKKYLPSIKLTVGSRLD